MTQVKKRLSLGVAAIAAVTLSACGGDNFSRPAVTEQVPASASESSAGFIAYLRELVVSSADLLEPVDVSAVTPPQDDTSEPDPAI
jgi:hypothetical protein